MDQVEFPRLFDAMQQDHFKTVHRLELEKATKNHGSKIVSVLKDEGISGGKGREARFGFDKLLRGVTRKDFDMVTAWSVDRLGRSRQHLMTIREELKAKHVDLYIHQQGIDTSTPAGRMFHQVSGMFAESAVEHRIRAARARHRNS